MNAHTPGEWEAARVLPDGRIVTRSDTFEIRTPEYDVCAFVPQSGPVRKEADAHLMAAAPDMFAALKPFAYLARVMREGEILTHRGVYVTWEQAQAAAAAIAKAKPE